MQSPEELSPRLQQLWMDRLLRCARRVGEAGEIPVAAVLLDAGGHALGWGSNRRHRDQDPLGHAELVALRQAAALRRDWRFNDCTLLVTLEPCPMCAGALIQARVGRVVFAAADAKRGALGGCLDLARDPSAHHHMVVQGGLAAAPAERLLSDWFVQRRQGRRRGPAAVATEPHGQAVPPPR
jgi:tRNA(adenine34) deaminase